MLRGGARTASNFVVALKADVKAVGGKTVKDSDGVHHAVRAIIERPQPVAAAIASTPSMPASSTPTPQQASASSSIGAPVDFDDLLAKDRQLAQALLERIALDNAACIREQANAAADEHAMEFEPDWEARSLSMFTRNPRCTWIPRRSQSCMSRSPRSSHMGRVELI